MWKACFLLAICPVLIAAAPSTTQPTVKVEVASVSEFRASRIAKLGQFSIPSLTIDLNISGDKDNIHRTSPVRVSECRDYLGDDLRFKGDFPSVVGASPEVLHLSQAPRRAQKIAVLRGEVELYVGGKTNTLTFDKLKSRMGSSLSDPLLKQVGLDVFVGRVQWVPIGMAFAPPPLMNGLRVSDVQGAGIAEVRLLDADGTVKFRTSRLVSSKDGMVCFFLRQPITDSTTLQIDIYSGAERLIVPFELKDIPLP